MADARDDGRHAPGPQLLWGESWYFDFAAPGGEFGGFVRLSLYPNLGVAWYWAYLVGTGRQLVAVRDHGVALPRGRSLEIRAEALWSAINCETPNEHWSIGLEAYAAGMDDPAEAYRGERGDRVALGFDLEWEARAPAFDYPGIDRYQQSCSVHGDVLVGTERLAVDAFGQRDRWWGELDWWSDPWCWTGGGLVDGSSFGGLLSSTVATGYVLAPGGRAQAVSTVSADTVFGSEGLPLSASIDLGRAGLAVTPLAHAPVLIESSSGRSSRLARSLCRYQAADGRLGEGWTEWLQP